MKALPSNSLKLTVRAWAQGGVPSSSACARIGGGLPASAGQPGSRPLGSRVPPSLLGRRSMEREYDP
jgi:hypothetical protein